MARLGSCAPLHVGIWTPIVAQTSGKKHAIMAAADKAETPPATEARLLLRAARAGTLATQRDGQPFAGLVTPATAPDLSLLMLLSDLSEHTRHLRADPRCAVMVIGEAAEANPQTAPRLTIAGRASITADALLRARWLALHPYAALYFDFGDFNLWQMEIAEASFVGGFARAFRLPPAKLLPDPGAVAAVAAAADSIMAHCNDDHAAALTRIALAGIAGDAAGAWRMVAVDVDGCDLAAGEVVRRIDWAAPVRDAGGVRAELVRLAA